MTSIGSPLLWGGFTAFILAMLALDLGVFHRTSHEVRFKEALSWTFVWIALALAFNAGVYHWFGAQKGMEFLTGYVIEKALSVDNVFVFLVIFSVFAVPAKYQHRVLFWGVLGALVMRAIFIFAGAALLQRFHWVIYIFGALLVVTGIKLLVQRNEEVDPEKNPIFRFFKRVIPATRDYHGAKFFVRENGKLLATPLFMVLVAVEASDLVFAVDSIPAIFAVTSDPFIVYTSNVFAILGLRALYFCLAGVMEKFHLLKVGLAFVLVFVGTKMLIIDVYKIPIGLSLVIVTLLLAGSIVASFVWPKRTDGADPSVPLESA
ncbi:MAG: TerC family protein [Thermoanaerobaculia bacterium]|nr:TerC family protein [Thermoanaerobaculia bacterium]